MLPSKAFAGLLDEFGDALEAQAERLGEDLLERVAPYRIVGNFRWRDRLPRKKPAAVHGCEALSCRWRRSSRASVVRAYGTVLPVNGTAIAALAPSLAAASAILLILDLSNPIFGICFHPTSMIGMLALGSQPLGAFRASGAAESAGKSAN